MEHFQELYTSSTADPIRVRGSAHGGECFFVNCFACNEQLSEPLEFEWLPAGTQRCLSQRRLWVSSEKQPGLHGPSRNLLRWCSGMKGRRFHRSQEQRDESFFPWGAEGMCQNTRPVGTALKNAVLGITKVTWLGKADVFSWRTEACCSKSWLTAECMWARVTKPAHKHKRIALEGFIVCSSHL